MAKPLYKVGDRATLIMHARFLDWGVPQGYFGQEVQIIEVRGRRSDEYYYRLDNRWYALESMLHVEGPW